MSAQANEDPLAILDAYDFELPEASIAQSATTERDSTRLLLLDRDSGELVEADRDHHTRDLADWLAPGDLLVVNSTQVLSARLVGRKRSGGAAEALLLAPEPEQAGLYRALLKCTGRVRVGLEIDFGDDGTLGASVEAIHERGEVSLRFDSDADPYSVGLAPLPPYIRRAAESDGTADVSRYQTIYAREPGAIAAPTAGLHFTEALFERLAERGVSREEVVLHVGAGTFRPLDAASLQEERLHEEEYVLPEATVAAIERTRAAGGRIIAVGTTTARVLESCADENGRLQAGSGSTQLFIRPGGRPFRVVDALVTNFHLPRSSLLLLVSAFVGREPLLAAYHHAIEAGFRFYSYGDAMLIAPGLTRGTTREGSAS